MVTKNDRGERHLVIRLANLRRTQVGEEEKREREREREREKEGGREGGRKGGREEEGEGGRGGIEEKEGGREDQYFYQK